jgi:uncharacterized protein (DUF302 family)
VDETLARIEQALTDKGIKVFSRIDHAAGAREAGLDLPPSVLLVFGNPKAGTPLMQSAPTIGIDLPLKVLVFEDDEGRVRAVWNSPDYLTARHGLDSAAGMPLAGAGKLLESAIQ